MKNNLCYGVLVAALGAAAGVQAQDAQRGHPS